MNIVTISREFGSGGRELGKKVAEILAYDYYDREIITEIAKRHNVDENYVDYALSTHAWQTYSLSFHHSFMSPVYLSSPDSKLLSEQRKIIEEIAEAGKNCIIVGRNADVLLHDKNPLNIFVCADMDAKIKEHNITCPKCGKTNFTDIRQFNLMFKTFQGVTEDAKAEIYLRPETAQGIFVNFKSVQRTSRKKVPFGIAQIGKSFRNEITPGNFTFRTREFEQMELEFFCKPDTDLEWFGYWKTYCIDWLKSLGIKNENLRYRDHAKEELSFYSKATTDIEFLFPMGWGELWGIADRTDYDLSVHMEHSKADLRYLDPETNERYTPYVVEPSLGLDRAILAFICNAYEREELENGDTREVLKIHPALAPVKATILPLIKKVHADTSLQDGPDIQRCCQGEDQTGK